MVIRQEGGRTASFSSDKGQKEEGNFNFKLTPKKQERTL